MQELNNVIIISIDCARKEALSCYEDKFPSLLHRFIYPFPLLGSTLLGGEPLLSLVKLILKLFIKPSTPNVDRLTKDGVLFTQAITQAPFTSASHASIFTGLYPFHHGIRQAVGYKLKEGIYTLAELLKENTFYTAAFIGSDALGKEYELDRGFDIFDFESDNTFEWGIGNFRFHRRSAKSVTNSALSLLNSIKNRNFFLFLHYFDAHELDYSRPYSFQPYFQIKQLNLIDTQLGRIVNFLKENHLYNRTTIVIVSDHGNSFGEHNEEGHREYLYDSTLCVPLIIKTSSRYRNKVVRKQVRLIDIAPTIIDILKIADTKDKVKNLDGISLSGFLNGTYSEDLPAYSETCVEVSTQEWQKLKSSYMCLRLPEWKLIINRLYGESLLYNIPNDKYELTNVIDKFSDIAKILSNMLSEMVKGDDIKKARPTMSRSEIEKVKRTLRSLGYLE